MDSEEGARAADRTAPRFCASVIILFISLAAPCEDTVRNQLHTSSVSKIQGCLEEIVVIDRISSFRSSPLALDPHARTTLKKHIVLYNKINVE